MDVILLVFIGTMCLMLGVRVFCAEEQNKIFNKRNLPLKNVKAYNHFCGGLIIGFGVIAEITMYFMVFTNGIASGLFTLAIIVEAILTMVVYQQVEKRMIRK